jgi:hypothetical protein
MDARVNGLLNLVQKHDRPGAGIAEVMLCLMVLNLGLLVAYFKIIDHFFWGALWEMVVATFAGMFSYNMNDTTYVETAATPSQQQVNWDLAFSSVAKCTYYSFGPSGSVQTTDYECVLPQMRYYSVIFLILPFFLIALTCAMALSIAFQVAVLYIPSCRAWYIGSKIKTNKYGQPSKKTLLFICKNIGSTTYLVLKTLTEHVEEMTMRNFIMAWQDTLIKAKNEESLSEEV